MTNNGWATLAAEHPWPDEQPSAPEKFRRVHGWLSEGTNKMLRAAVTPGATVVEVGSWLGRSTRHILTCTPTSRVVCIDHWKGDAGTRSANPEMHDLDGDPIYRGFLHQCWAWRARIIPIRADAIAGMQAVAAAGLIPRVVYIDAAHDYDSVLQHVRAALLLFPDALLVGDDFRLDGVRQAVTEIAADANRKLTDNVWAWKMEAA